MSKELTPLDYFIALGQTCLMQSKNYKNNEVVVLKNGEKHTAQELGGIVVDALKVLEIVKEMIDSDIGDKLNANSRKILKEIFESLPKEKQDLLNEVLL